MVPKPGLSPSAIRELKLILSVSSSYYAKILPLHRKSLEHRRFHHRKVKNLKGLRVKICPTLRMVASSVGPRVPASCTFSIPPASRVPQPSINPLKRSASPVKSILGPPSKKLRQLTNATAINIHLLNLVPLLNRLQEALILPSRIVLTKGKWLLIKQGSLVSLSEPLELPEDLLTIKVPPRLKISNTHPSRNTPWIPMSPQYSLR